jgi:hypothetical protein
MKRKLLVLVALCLVVCSAVATELSDYGNTTSMYINITPSMGAQMDYQIMVIMSNASGVSGYYAPDNVVFTNGTTRPDWFDINVTDGSDTPLPFWVENNTYTAYNATVWIKSPTIAFDNSSVLKLRYGNSSQSESTMNGYTTFPLYDDFVASSINTTQWTLTGTPSISNGIATFVDSSAGTKIISKTSFARNYSYRARLNFNYGTDRKFSNGFINSTGTSDYAFFYGENTGYSFLMNGGATNTSSLGTGYSAYHVYEIKRLAPSKIVVTSDGSYVLSSVVASDIPTLSLPASTGVKSTSKGASSASDWIFIKKSLDTEPITSLYSTSSTSGTPPVASFTCTPTSTTLGESIACTDTSSDTPTNWTYYWGDGNVTDGTQNPSYTYPFTGTFSINQTVNNTLGSSWYNRSNYITITNVTSFTQQDIYLTGQYTITFIAKSSTTNLPIANVTVVDAVSGQSYPSTNGTAFLTLPAGLYYINFIADGYQTKQITYVVDQDETHEVKLVPSETPNNPVYNVYPPKDVKFHITSFFGAPIQNANVTIQGITTSTGNWDWLVTLLGISLDEVAINGTAMTESTDTNGDVVFLMLPSVKYNITTTATGYTFPTTFIAPQAIEYTITANWNESWFSSGNDTLKDVNVSVSWVKINSTHSFVNITYDDQTTTTTGGDFRIYREAATRMANATPIAVMNITSSSCSNSTIVNTPTGGAEYRVDVNASTTSGDRVLRTFTHSFKGAPVNLPGWTPETQLWLALFILIFTAAFAGVLHAPQMGVILCVELWVFWSIGWMEYLINGNGYTEAALLIIFTLATFFTVVWSITEGKSKGKRSS